MLSTVRRYRQLLGGMLARCFPRTAAYLRDEREAALFHPQPQRPPKAAKAASGRTRKAPAAGRNKRGDKPQATRVRKPRA